MSQQHSIEKPMQSLPEEKAQPEILYLPKTMQDWPWPRVINPHFEEVTREANAWFRSFKPLNERSQYAFDLCEFGRLASLAYPYVSKEQLRIGVDLMNVFFLIDECTDVKPMPVVEEIIEIAIDALHHPQKPRPAGEIVLGEIMRQFWARGEKIATTEAAKHFVEACTDYLRSVIEEADDRDKAVSHTVAEYFEARRRNVGVRPSFSPGELHLSIPDYAFYNPVIKKLEYFVIDLIILDNDIASYNKEQATGNDHCNLITVVMHQFNLPLADAINWAASYHKEIVAKFLDTLKSVPSWGKAIDDQVSVYIEHLAGWPRSNDCWTFEGGRYFGSKGPEIQQSRRVPLLTKRVPITRLCKEDVAIPIIDSL